MRITEIFYSIQGESSFAGLPCAFVRLTWCNLRCAWCDSEYTFTGGVEMSVDEVMEKVRGYGCKLVEITGGEPLVQKRECAELSRRLCDEGYTVLVETVFDWPGIGLYAVNAAVSSDFQPIMGVTLLIGLNFMLANLLVDLAYGWLDPRLRRRGVA